MSDNQPNAAQNHRWHAPDASLRSPVLNHYETIWNPTSPEHSRHQPRYSPSFYIDRDGLRPPYSIKGEDDHGCHPFQGSPDTTSITGLPPHQLTQITTYIQAHLEEELGLEKLAAIAQLSQSHFSRAFKRSTGMSPHQYVIYCRVERAKQLLKQKTMSICDVAIACGFTHQSHLNRHFKRLTGVTPKTFLKS